MSAQDLSPELRRALKDIARTPRLLVASDYDGCMAPIVSRPEDARPNPDSVRAMRAIADLDSTTAAVISGRALRDLATLSRLPAEVHLVGSHGSEFDIGFVHEISAAATELLDTVVTELRAIAVDYEGVTVETKPASTALHVRNASDTDSDSALHRVRVGPATWDGVQVTEGKSVIELAVIRTDKGQALDILRHQAGAGAAIFFGDDVTDEKAFRRLHGPDFGVKVGDGDTLATYRVTDTDQVALALAFLYEERRAWLRGENAAPIERLSMLASPRTVALLTPDAKMCWMCHPEPDSAAVFASLLGTVDAGEFGVRPHVDGDRRAPLPQSQRYVDGTMTIATRWAGLEVVDYLPHDVAPGRTDLVRVITGSVPAMVEFAPRPEFGQASVQIEAVEDGLRVYGSNEPIVLRAPGVTWRIDTERFYQRATAVVDASNGPVVLELRCGTDYIGEEERTETQRRELAQSYWSDWSAGLALPVIKPDLMKRSALTLKGLVHADTGSIMAAATTSLPEEIGGVRNWDYRYCWLRDAALTASALVSVGSHAEAEGYLTWLYRVLGTVNGPEWLHPLYTLAGGGLPPEAIIDSLPGYAGSRPVRVGNAANQQVQLDVFGPIVELIGHLADARAATGDATPLTDADWDLVANMVWAVERRWFEPDHGIWEIRGNPRHHVYSKVMCWMTVDRALKIGERFGREVEPGWSVLRDVIAGQVIDQGWNAEVRSFTAAYEGTDLDAATLHIGLAGMIDPADPRFTQTVEATEAELRSGATVYRYHHDDGLPGGEGGFHLCAAWLVEAYLLIGRRTDAEALFDQLVKAAGPTGLLSEEYDPVAERSLGNHPQAYSHIGLLRCAALLAG
ncbi:trehalose-phosphatase [Williamsia herbipolensis]|uniref:Trehalose-phosphatase n=1 Tax=Williamsia herbipolensis TaxID=1603258 RepID=A0AAU4JZW4_9NOCA|nr:trehalose-phosphatase [Williamsia herbipolensis]